MLPTPEHRPIACDAGGYLWAVMWWNPSGWYCMTDDLRVPIPDTRQGQQPFLLGRARAFQRRSDAVRIRTHLAAGSPSHRQRLLVRKIYVGVSLDPIAGLTPAWARPSERLRPA